MVDEDYVNFISIKHVIEMKLTSVQFFIKIVMDDLSLKFPQCCGSIRAVNSGCVTKYEHKG